MKLTQDELIDVCSEVTTMLGAILARHVELNESLIGNEAIDTAKKKLESLRQQTADAKAELQKLWYAQRRKRELEKIRDDHARERRADGGQGHSAHDPVARRPWQTDRKTQDRTERRCHGLRFEREACQPRIEKSNF